MPKKIKDDEMCINMGSKRNWLLKRWRIRVYGLSRRRCKETEDKNSMELKNLTLYLKNKSIMEENEELKKKANFLDQENLGLMSEIKKKLPDLGSEPLPIAPFPLLCEQ